MESRIAKVISYLLHPIFIPMYVLVFLLNFSSSASLILPFSYMLKLAGAVFLITIAMPLLLIWSLNRLGYVASIHLTTKEERMYPILSMAFFYYIAFYVLKDLHVTSLFSYYMLGATLLTSLTLIVNFYAKISLHMIGIGSFTGLFLGMTLNFGIDYSGEILTGILLGGVIGFARLRADSHTPAEIYSGFAAGCLILTGVIVSL